MSLPTAPIPGLKEAIQKSQQVRDAVSAPPARPTWEKTAKRILAGLVIAAGAGMAIFPPHTIAYQVCAAVVGLGGLGITSKGNP